MPAITAPHTTTTIFFFHKQHYCQLPQPLTNCTPVIAGVGMQTLVRVGGNESIDAGQETLAVTYILEQYECNSA